MLSLGFFFWTTFTTCSPTVLLLPPGAVEVAADRAAVARAKKRCPTLYPQSPCARTVERRKELSYWVICGKYDR